MPVSTVMLLSVSSWLAASVLPGLQDAVAYDLQLIQMLHSQNHDHRCKASKEGITYLNRELSLMEEYRHFPLAFTEFIKPVFHHTPVFPYQFHTAVVATPAR